MTSELGMSCEMQQENTKCPSTESKEALAFVKFTCDLISFGLLQVLNAEWRFPNLKADGRTFDEKIGMAAVIFRHRHADEFTDSIADCPVYVLEDIDDTLVYIQDFIRKTFKGRIPLMEFIVYCAFIVDLTICCYEEGKKEFIEDIAEESYDVYQTHIKQHFRAIGGWPAISRMADHYLQFYNSMKLYAALESDATRSGTPCFETVNDNKSGVHLRASARNSGNDSEDAKDGHASDAVTVGEDNATATEDAPDIDTCIVYMRNGNVIPSTVTREDVATGSEDIDLME